MTNLLIISSYRRIQKENYTFFYAYCSIVLPLQSCKKTSTEIQENDDALNDENLAAASNAPNIVIFIGDDIGYEIPTVNGGQSYITPNIDALAQSGLRFTQCYASANCSPSRTMLLTGKYNFRNYVDWGTLPRTNLTIGKPG
jgi:arylsulfatase A